MKEKEYDELLYKDLLNCCLNIDISSSNYSNSLSELQNRIVSAYDEGSITENQYDELSEYVCLSQLCHGDI